jgi:hypothetical protein
MGLYEYLEGLEGKIRDGIFFCVNKSDNFSVSSHSPRMKLKGNHSKFEF